jgi:hypothetical protein
VLVTVRGDVDVEQVRAAACGLARSFHLEVRTSPLPSGRVTRPRVMVTAIGGWPVAPRSTSRPVLRPEAVSLSVCGPAMMPISGGVAQTA